MQHSSPAVVRPVHFLIPSFLLSTLAPFVVKADPAPCAPPPAGLVAWWQAEEDAVDSIGGNNGVLTNGATFAPGVVGQAFEFDGINQSAIVPDAPSLNPISGLTLECWFYAHAYPPSYGWDLLSKDGEYAGPRQYLLTIGPAPKYGLTPHVGVSGGFLNFVGNSTVLLSNWYHVAMTYDGAELRLYLNGQLDGSQAVSGPLISSSEPFRIGGGAPPGQAPYYFPGLIDEVSVYERALGSNEITEIFLAGSAGKCFTNPACPLPEGLVAYYPFSGDASDQSGNGNHALATNTTLVPDLLGSPDSAMAFNNVGLVNCGNPPAFQFGQSNFTLTALVNAPSTSGGAFKYILSKEKCYEQGSQFRLEVRDNMVAFGLTDKTGAQMGLWDGWWRLRAPLPVGTWAGVTVVRDGLTLNLYVNGLLENSVTMTGSPDHTNSHDLLIGARHGCSSTYGDFFHGALDEIRVFDRALGPSEIFALYQHDALGLCPTNPPTVESVVLVDAGTPGFYNDALGTMLDGTGPQFPLPLGIGGDPEFYPADEPDLTAAAAVLGNWLASPPELNGNWQALAQVPATWSINTETAIIYEVQDGQDGLTNLWGDFDVDNGLYVWVNGQYRFGARAPGLPSPEGQFEYTNVFLGTLPPGTNHIQVLREDNAVATGYQVRIRATRQTAEREPEPPVITQHPSDQVVAAGDTVTFSVLADGTPPLWYLWFKGNDAIGGATGSSLTLGNVQPDQAGSFFVVVSNAFGSVTSSNAVLTVETFPPCFTSQPQDQSVHLGRSVTFAALVAGTAPLHYQWQKDGTNLPSANATTLTLSNVQSNDAGSYQLIVTNLYGSAPSRLATLTILPPPVCVPLPEDAVAWWPGESNTWDVVGGFDGTFYQAPPSAPLYATGIVGTAFKFQPSWAITVPQAPDLNLGIGDGFTFEAWVNPDSVSGTYGIFGWGGSSPVAPSTPVGVNLRILNPGILQAQLVKTNGQTIILQTAASFLQSWLWQHVALSCSTTNGDVALYLNGLVVAQTNLGPTALRTTGVLHLGNAAGPPLYGLLDEPTLYARALMQTEVQSVYLADIAGKCPVPPPPCVDPPGIVALWRGESNTVDSAAGNHAIMVPTNYPPQLAYQTGQAGAAFSLDGPNFLSVPRSESLDVGKAAGLTIEGWIYPQPYSGVPIVEWTDSNTFGVYLAVGYAGPGNLEANLIDVTNGFHRIQAPYAIGGTYWAHVALTYDKASGQAALYLNGSAVAATNLGTFTPRTDTDLLVGFHPRYTGTPVSGAPPTIDRRFAGAMDELGIYQRALSSQEIRALARLGVNRCMEFPPTIGRQPADQIALEGDSILFSVGAGGSEPLSYQWFFEGTAVPRADRSTWNPGRLDLSDAGRYWVTVSNAFGSTTSRVATLTVLPAGQCLQPPPGAVAWWRGENNEWDVFEVSDAFWGLSSPASFTNGLVGTAFRLLGTSYLQVPANPELNVSLGAGFSVEGWIKPDFATQPQAIFDWNDTRGTVGIGLMLSRTGPGVLEVTLTDTNAISTPDRMVTFTTPPYTVGSQTNPVTGWTHLALTFDKPSGRTLLFVNGRQVAERVIAPIRTVSSPQFPAPFTPATSGNFYFGYRPSGFYSGPRFRGALDEFTVYDRSLSETELQSIYVVGANGKCSPPPPACLVVIPEIVGWWRGESNTLDSVQDNDVAIFPPSKPVTASYAPGRVGTAFRFVGGDHLQTAASASLDVGPGPGLTLEAWINPSQFRPQPIIEWNSGTGSMGVNLSYSSTGGTGTMEVNLVDTNGVSHQLFTPPNTVSFNTWLHVAATYDKASGTATLYYNGQPITNRVVGSFTPRTSSNLYFGYRPPGTYPGSGLRFTGSMDEMAIYGRALTTNEIHSAYRSRIGKCTEPPVIVEHPVSQRVNAGTPVVISGVVTGNPLLRYQWFKDGIPLPGIAGPALEILSAEELHQGIYAFTVSNNFGMAVSSNALLLVNYPPVADASLTLPLVISPNNTNATVVLDGSLTMDPDDDPLVYQWLSTLSNQPSTLIATDLVAVVTLPVGNHAIQLVVDDGMLSDTNTIMVDVITPAQAAENLVQAVQDADLEHRQNLIAILSAALATIDRSNPTAAINQLQAFQQQVLAQLAPLDSALAAQFVQQAQEIIDILQGGSIGSTGNSRVAARVSNGKVSLEFTGATSRIHLIEASSDMVHWQRIAVARHRGNGQFEFEDPQSDKLPNRYYRIVAP